jgi:hypothetical protein
MTVQEFLNLDAPYEYDFKFLRHNEPDPIERFMAYRIAYKNGSSFDCDCAPLTMEIQCLLYNAVSYYKRYLTFRGETVETDTINSFWTRYKRARDKNNAELRKFAVLTHTIGNFNIGQKGFNVTKGRIFNWQNEKFDRFDWFCRTAAEHRNWFFERRFDTLMYMYFESDGSPVLLDELAVVNNLIVERGKRIVEILRERKLWS